MYKNICSSKMRMLLFYGLTLLCNTNLFAYPIATNVILACPCSNELQNSGGIISGEGTELILFQDNPVTFTSIDPQPNVPTDLSNYRNAGINYDAALGEVSCTYASTASSEPSFVLVYSITNGAGGLIQIQSSKIISIILPLGLR
jgi:hypothetical protein